MYVHKNRDFCICSLLHYCLSDTWFSLLQDFKIQNIVGSCDVKFPIRLEGLAYSHGAFSSVSDESMFISVHYLVFLFELCVCDWRGGCPIKPFWNWALSLNSFVVLYVYTCSQYIWTCMHSYKYTYVWAYTHVCTCLYINWYFSCVDLTKWIVCKLNRSENYYLDFKKTSWYWINDP